MMRYENLPCPVCGSHMHEDDDIVVCPDCATPQHRSCWMENGHCVNIEKHGTGFVWTPGANSRNPDFKAEGTKTCHICGKDNEPDAEYCKECGALLLEPEKEAEPVEEKPAEPEISCPYCGETINAKYAICPRCGAPLHQAPHNPYNNPYASAAGVNEFEIIGGHTAGELSMYVRTNVSKYISKFKNLEGGKGFSFNWAAFIFGPLWFFFRKLYKEGIPLLIVSACIGLISSSVSDTMVNIFGPYSEQIEQGTLSYDVFTNLMNEFTRKSFWPMVATLGFLLLLHIICALIANKVYYNKILRDFETLGNEVSDINMRNLLISRRGGVSILSGICGYFTYQVIMGIFMNIAGFAANHF